MCKSHNALRKNKLTLKSYYNFYLSSNNFVSHQKNDRRKTSNNCCRITTATAKNINTFQFFKLNVEDVIIVITSLFTKLLWPGNSKRTLITIHASSCHLPTCVTHTVEASRCSFFTGKRQAVKLWILLFIVFGLT